MILYGIAVQYTWNGKAVGVAEDKFRKRKTSLVTEHDRNNKRKNNNNDNTVPVIITLTITIIITIIRTIMIK